MEAKNAASVAAAENTASFNEADVIETDVIDTGCATEQSLSSESPGLYLF